MYGKVKKKKITFESAVSAIREGHREHRADHSHVWCPSVDG
jgi:hypothetical protein